jgi:hypothetical protein
MLRTLPWSIPIEHHSAVVLSTTKTAMPYSLDLENSFEAGKTFSSQTLQPKQQQAALTSLALSANDGASVSED